MAGPWYVRSTDGSDGSDGLSWANAKATLAAAATASSAGDTIYISSSHTETQASAITITFPGTFASPNYVLCVNDSAEPPTAVATGAQVRTNASNAHIYINGCAYIYGVRFQTRVAGSGTGNIIVANSSNQWATYENCTFDIGYINTIRLSTQVSSTVTLKGCSFVFGNTDAGFDSGATANAYIDGGSLSGSAIAKVLKSNSAGGGCITFSGVDLSAAASSVVLSAANWGPVVFRNCKLPASWSGSISTGTTVNRRVEMHNCDAGDTNYRIGFQDHFGTMISETTLVRTGGSSDGTTALSWKVVSDTTATFNRPFITPEIVQWNETTGSSVTATVEILRDSATNLTDAEVWLEVMYLGTSGYPLGTWISDCKADFLASEADQTTSSETWTTTGMSNPNEQKLSVSFTPQEKGFVHARVCVAKASATLYVCPKVTLS